MKKKEELVIMGVDPGSAVTGFGLIKTTQGEEVTLLDYGTIKANRELRQEEKLKKIHDGLLRVMKKLNPDEFAIEEAFYAKNAKTAMVMGQVRGVAILASAQAGIPVAEYSPREIKQSVAGSGGASKSQVQFMVKNLLQLKKPPEPEDAADALAVALCHAQKIRQIRRNSYAIKEL
jgi:crossover junction endodeoxyribonuclease RuvC